MERLRWWLGAFALAAVLSWSPSFAKADPFLFVSSAKHAILAKERAAWNDPQAHITAQSCERDSRRRVECRLLETVPVALENTKSRVVVGGGTLCFEPLYTATLVHGRIRVRETEFADCKSVLRIEEEAFAKEIDAVRSTAAEPGRARARSGRRSPTSTRVLQVSSAPQGAGFRIPASTAPPANSSRAGGARTS